MLVCTMRKQARKRRTVSPLGGSAAAATSDFCLRLRLWLQR